MYAEPGAPLEILSLGTTAVRPEPQTRYAASFATLVGTGDVVKLNGADLLVYKIPAGASARALAQGETSGKLTTLPKRLKLMGGRSSSPWGGGRR
jgi:hypothetical protein